MKIAYGPDSELPSFNWVARDVFNAMSKSRDLEVTSFKGISDLEIDKINVVFFVKTIPSLSVIEFLKKKRIKQIFIPVDLFNSKYLIKLYEVELSLCDAVLLHCDRLRKYIPPVTNVFFIEHYIKYEVNRSKEAIEKNSILWIGHMQYIPALFDYLNKTDLGSYTLKILSDIQNYKKRREIIKKEIIQNGGDFHDEIINDEIVRINGVVIQQWSVEKQREFLECAQVAIDTKNDSFSQATKPPTKSQIYISAGIPLAIDKDSYSSEYFLKYGLELCDSKDLKKLFSKKYHSQIFDSNYYRNHDSSLPEIANNYSDILYEVIERDSTNFSKIYYLKKYFRSVQWMLNRLLNKFNLIDFESYP